MTTTTSGNSLSVDDLGSTAQRERRQRILDATYALAREGGYDAVQMRAVADQADVALGTLYRYFPSKVHLLVSALAREFERTDDLAARRRDPRRHHRRARHPRHEAHDARPPGRPPAHRGAHPRLHVRRRLRGHRDPHRRHAAHLDAHPRDAPLRPPTQPTTSPPRRTSPSPASSATSGSRRWSPGSPAAPPRPRPASTSRPPSACSCATDRGRRRPARNSPAGR